MGILPRQQLEVLVLYLVRYGLEQSRQSEQNGLSRAVCVSWVNILLDAHLGTFAMTQSAEMRRCVRRMKDFLVGYEREMAAMVQAQANVHCILAEMKRAKEDKERQGFRNGVKSSRQGIGAGAFGVKQQELGTQQSENDPDLYKDYVVEYIKL